MQKINKDAIKNRWGYQMIAIALALILWFYVAQMQNPTEERLYDVPLDYKNLPATMAVSDKTDTVKVRIQGPKNVVEDVLAKDITAYLDLSDANIGQFVGKIKIELPEKVQLVSVNPIDIAVEIQELTEVQVPVEVRYTTPKLTDGYTLLSPAVYPEEVIIAGPKDKIELLSKAYVNVELSDITSNFESSMPVNMEDENGNSLNSWLTVQPSNVDVMIPVISSSPEKMAPISVSVTGEPADGYMVSRVIVEPSVVKIYGMQELLDTVSYVYTSPIDISGAKNDVSQQVDLVGTDGIKLDFQEKAKVVISIEEKATKTIDNVLVNLTNTNSGYDYSLNQNAVSIRVTGPKSIVNNLSAGNFSVQADMTNYDKGRHTVTLNATLSASAKIEQISPSNVIVTVTDR